MSESTFARQLTYLAKRGYRTPPMSELLAGSGSEERTVSLTLDDGYLDNYTVAFPLLLEFGFSATIFLVADFRRRKSWWDGNAPTSSLPLMEKSHVREMVRHGIEIGAHGVTHTAFPDLHDRALSEELSSSKKELEDLVGKEVRTLAYPYGAVDERTKRMVKHAGYHAAFAVNSGPFRIQADPFEVRRVFIGDRADDPYMFLKLSGLERAARWVRSCCVPTTRPRPVPLERASA